MGTARKAVIYTLVDTGPTSDRGDSSSGHLAALSAAVERRGWVLGEHLSDSGLSGDRPGLTAALDLLTVGDADVLVVATFDHLVRSAADFARLMLRAARERWDLVIIDIDVDTTTPSGQLMLEVAAGVAEYELDLMADRARVTHQRSTARGVRAGQAPILPDSVRHRVAAMRADGLTLQAIADRLSGEGVPTARGGSWHPSTIRHVLRSVGIDAELDAARRSA